MIGLSYWGGQCLFNRPTTGIYSHLDSSWFDSNMLCPFHKRQHFTIQGEKTAPTGIALLFLAGGPSTIFWRVIAIVIDSVQCITRAWFRAHISKKVLKAFLPSVTYLNSTASPISKIRLTHIIASAFHGYPGTVFRSFGRAMSKSILSPFKQTPATFSRPRSQSGNLYKKLITTIASTFPICNKFMSFSDWARFPFRQYNQSPKSLPCSVFEWWHINPFYYGVVSISCNYTTGDHLA